jgi:FkbM family methyltransferase
MSGSIRQGRACPRSGVRTRRLPLWLRQVVRRLLDGFVDTYATKSYSQEGEDMILRRLFGLKSDGFYVDVGAHHPRRYSNTNFFYKLGWSGINIEPNPDAMRVFRSGRRRDINLELGVSDRAGLLKYHVFEEPALNTFDEAVAKSRLENTPYKLKNIVDVRVERLDDILTENLPRGREIDFLSIDVEGLDFKVLQSNDWQRFRPKCVIVEALGSPLEHIKESAVYLYMVRQGYELIAKTFNSLIFRELR